MGGTAGRIRIAFCLSAALAAAAVTAALYPDSASSATPVEVKAQLLDAELSPTPLYPTRLPGRLKSAHASLKIRGQQSKLYSVVLIRGKGRGFMILVRAPLPTLRGSLRKARRRGGRPTKARIGSRTAFKVPCSRGVCGFVWREQGLAYGVFGRYRGHRPTLMNDARVVVRSLEPLTPTP